MRRLTAVLLALTVLLAAIPAMAEPAVSEGAAPLPSVGDVVEGFEVIDIRPFDIIGADLVLFEHQKTGAKLMYIASDDTNRAFQLTFLTRPVDNTGVPHVFEHSTLSGSEKYPGTSLFMNLSYQTYNTYMNAYTTDAMTGYPIASLSEAQLLKLADYYTDCCLHPMIMTDESIFRTEAWRYEMTDMDSPLTLNGTVYSEMAGALTLQRSALDNANEVTFPGSSLSFNYGGVPEYIPDMTWEHLKEYHDAYYHPSNCIALLYGSFSDYSAFLKLLDEAFSPYEKREFSFVDSGYTRISEPVTASVPYPVAESSDTVNQSYVYYYIICPGLKDDAAAQTAVDHVGQLLNANGSSLRQKLKKVLPSGTFSFGREVAAPDDAFVFVAGNVNPEDTELFRQTVNDSLKDISVNGFDPVQLDSILASLKLDSKLASESGDPVNSVLFPLAYYYAVTGDPFDYVRQVEALSSITEENDSGLLTSVISDWLTDPELYTLTVTYPAPGGKEKQDEALAARLEEVKAAMSDEEKQAVIDSTNAEEPEDDTGDTVASLTAVGVADLPEEIREYEISDVTGEDGVRRLDAVAGVDGVGMVQLYLDARALPQEDIHYLRLFTRLLGELDTETHTKEEVAVLMDRYLKNRTIGVSVFDTPEKDDFRSLFIAQWISLDEDLSAGYDLINEIVFHTQFTDVQTLSDFISSQKASVRSTITANPYSPLWKRQEGITDPASRYYGYLNYTEYYSFLEELERLIADNPDQVVSRLEGIRSFLANRDGAIAAFAGSEESAALNRPLADAFFAGLPLESRDYPVYELPEPMMREALAVDGSVQYNCVVSTFTQMGIEPDYSLEVIGQLVTDQLLLPVLRDQMGAYGVFCGINDDTGLYLISYRDPNVKATFDLYDTLPEKIAELVLTQEKVDGYILSSYSALAKPKGELSGASAQISLILQGKSTDIAIQKMRAYKSVTPESVKEASEVFARLIEKGARGTAGSIGAVKDNADLYDVVLNPFHTTDLSETSFTDVAEGSEHYDAIRFVFENGLMSPKEEGVFAPDDTAAVGDLLFAVCVGAGIGSAGPVEARDALAGYGLVAGDLDVEAGLTEGFLCGLLANAFGAELSTDTPDAEVTRADLADLLSQMFNQ